MCGQCLRGRGHRQLFLPTNVYDGLYYGRNHCTLYSFTKPLNKLSDIFNAFALLLKMWLNHLTDNIFLGNYLIKFDNWICIY